jgi:Tfp pilus assembly protein PilF
VSAEARSGREPHSWVARLLAWGLLACCAGCAGPERPWVGVVDEGPRAHEAISAATLDEVREGVREFERGDFEAARQTFGRALREAPDDLRVAIWLQDATLVSAEARAVRLGLSTTSTTSPRAQLRRSYRTQAESKPSAFAFLLAARLEDDQRAAELLFERALELEPGLAWAHYGLAHSAARGGDWGRAREELLRTFELDPAHLPALRLFAWAQATAGELDQAILAYEAWLERADEDLLVTESQRHALRLDLALAYLGASLPRASCSTRWPVRTWTSRDGWRRSRQCCRLRGGSPRPALQQSRPPRPLPRLCSRPCSRRSCSSSGSRTPGPHGLPGPRSRSSQLRGLTWRQDWSASGPRSTSSA